MYAPIKLSDGKISSLPHFLSHKVSTNLGAIHLKQAGIYEEFLKLVRPAEDAKRIMDKDGAILLDIRGSPLSQRPEVDRGELRDMLINSLPENAIQWDHKATSIDAFGTNQYEVKFANGRAFRADVLIGADGAWSKVRPLMTTAKPEYSGTCFIEIAYPADGREAERLAAAIGTGTLVATAPGKGIIAHRNADSSISGYVALNKPESWIRSIDFSHAQNSRELVSAQFKSRSEQLVDFITTSTLAKPTIRPIFALPVGHDWSRKAGITLIGDATHLMSPFAGEGANLAMYDGADLAGAIIANPNDLEQAILTYELALFERTLDVARMSAENLRLFFGETAPHSVVDLFSGQPDLAANEFPAHADFVYGEWLRDGFQAGEVPLPHSDPEYTLVLSQAYSEAFSLYGPTAQTLLPPITSEDVKAAMRILLPSLVEGLHGDERNVLLTLARMLYTATVGQFTSKDHAALWAMALLSEPSADVLSYARSAYLGEVIDAWSERRIEGVALADDLSCRISGLLG